MRSSYKCSKKYIYLGSLDITNVLNEISDHLHLPEGKEGQSLLEKRLQEIVQGEGEDGIPIAHLQESSLTLSFLPQSIRNFR